MAQLHTLCVAVLPCLQRGVARVLKNAAQVPKCGSVYRTACKWSIWYCCSWLDLRVKAEGISNEVLQFACSFGVGEGTRRPNCADV